MKNALENLSENDELLCYFETEDELETAASTLNDMLLDTLMPPIEGNPRISSQDAKRYRETVGRLQLALWDTAAKVRRTEKQQTEKTTTQPQNLIVHEN